MTNLAITLRPAAFNYFNIEYTQVVYVL